MNKNLTYANVTEKIISVKSIAFTIFNLQQGIFKLFFNYSFNYLNQSFRNFVFFFVYGCVNNHYNNFLDSFCNKIAIEFFDNNNNKKIVATTSFIEFQSYTRKVVRHKYFVLSVSLTLPTYSFQLIVFFTTDLINLFLSKSLSSILQIIISSNRHFSYFFK